MHASQVGTEGGFEGGTYQSTIGSSLTNDLLGVD